MEDAGSDSPPSPPELEREPKKRARKKPDLSGIEPKEITIKTKKGERTFAARSKPKKEVDAPPPSPANPYSSLMNSWLD